MEKKAAFNLALLLSALVIAAAQAWQTWEVVYPIYFQHKFGGFYETSWFLERASNAMMASCVALVARRFLGEGVTVWPAVALFAVTIGSISIARYFHRTTHGVFFFLVAYLFTLARFLIRDGTSLFSSISLCVGLVRNE